jgi:hypothetical protein
MIALRRSKVQTQRDVLAGKSPAIQLNVNATRMSQTFAGSSYIQQMVLGEVNEFVQRYRGSVAPPVDLALRALQPQPGAVLVRCADGDHQQHHPTSSSESTESTC